MWIGVNDNASLSLPFCVNLLLFLLALSLFIIEERMKQLHQHEAAYETEYVD